MLQELRIHSIDPVAVERYKAVVEHRMKLWRERLYERVCWPIILVTAAVCVSLCVAASLWWWLVSAAAGRQLLIASGVVLIVVVLELVVSFVLVPKVRNYDGITRLRTQVRWIRPPIATCDKLIPDSALSTVAVITNTLGKDIQLVVEEARVVRNDEIVHEWPAFLRVDLPDDSHYYVQVLHDLDAIKQENI